MKNFLIGLLIYALGLFVVAPLFLAGISAWLWMSMLFDAPFLIGLGISTVTLVVAVVVEVKLANY